ncbi:tetratricopeptide repeat (TPR)-like superfamily protein isoform X2 [Wolffia australiana]
MAETVEAPSQVIEASAKESEIKAQTSESEAIQALNGELVKSEEQSVVIAEAKEIACSSGDGDGLARAEQLFEQGSKAIEGGDYVEAVDCLSRALEIKAAHYGELAPECASSYYKYGCALLYKAQEEADPLGNVPKDSSENPSKGAAVKTGDGTSGSKNLPPKKEKEIEQGVDGSSDNEMEEDGEGSDDEDLGEDDEEDSDLDLAWKMLDIARAIVEKSPGDTLEKVNILSALGEVAIEREDVETSLNDYHKALSILTNIVEQNHRRIIELNFRICLVLELCSRTEEAIPYCKKASLLCQSRLEQLKSELASMKAVEADSLPAAILEKERDIEAVSGILNELERKLEDLQQVLLNPKPLFAEMMKMIASGLPNADKNSAPSLDSSKAGTSVNGSASTVAVATTTADTMAAANSSGGNGSGVTHLGVVGRGLKRASPVQIPIDPSSEKKNKVFGESSEG